ncbi:uncharacterized protein F5Z01DRAFT_631379 [Emericellopsis atlantica]|uniref:Uncharacterized protein n=1 Tax=Emericellopsis atlantica TaxID=2614577 RepID=A0A9P8CJL6_9HYPO|nr:uncharacterized protein F5Z01DRAFT_631379 [Emericellopsis atlantica]KAG9249599.1 hypothetical protein F5Z01DRAFT_631379 [Emericellopsis atlantica]
MVETLSARALRGSPILLLLPLIICALVTFIGPIGEIIRVFREKGAFARNGVSVPIYTSFYGIKALDATLADITLAFAQSQMHPADPASYWQGMTFVNEYAGLYAIILLEGCREFIVNALLAPLWFFAFSLYAYLVTSSPARAAISASDAATVLPTLILAYYPASLGMYFHRDYEARHWWSWVWQLYPIWGAAVFSISGRFLRPIIKLRTKHVLRTVVGAVALVNTSLWWYTIRHADVGLFKTFVPQSLLHLPEDPALPLRALFQYDQIGSFAAVSIWLLAAIGDMRTRGMTGVSFVALLLAGVGLTFVFGWGNAILLGWLWREELLAMHAESMKPASRTQ